METAVRYFVHLPSLGNDRYVNGLIADAAEEQRPICLVFNYHLISPYHGRPPHLLDDGGIYTRDGRGYGLAPFGWTRGWVWARERIEHVLEAINPAYMQQGVEPDVRNGWGWHTEPRYHYNDTMSIFKQAARLADWEGTFVVAEAPTKPDITTSGLRCARLNKGDGADKFDRVVRESAMTWLPAIPDDDDDPVDDESTIVALTVNLLDLTPRQLKRFKRFLDSLE